MYTEPEQEAIAAFLQRDSREPVVMLNLLRFKEVADYTDVPHLAPPSSISGGEILFQGTGGDCLIGPPDEQWDLVLLVSHASVEAFLAFASNEEYLAGAGHRTAALQDSRLLPLDDEATS